ncbi:MAG TPA: lipid-A-disaccharide synthase [Acidobacteriota bacterium]|nr:lipid-A-disaccharide synthase [Acidobacteriota bacterium]
MVASREHGADLLVVAGEASGDLHGSSLIREIKQLRPQTEVIAIGGDLMAASGAELLAHYRHLAVVGITEVLGHLGEIRRAMSRVLDAASARRVRAVVLIDYPDFNLRLARRLRRARPDLPIVYYISPQVWAWRRGRVRQIARLVDRMLVILPFEKELYEGAGLSVDFVGHPLLDVIPATGEVGSFAERHALDLDRRWIALLPGSRRAEVERLLPTMLEAAAQLAREGAYEYIVPVAAALGCDSYRPLLDDLDAEIRAHVHLIENDTYEAVRHARAAVVCSGTATLEVALLGTPEVVVYRTSWLTYNLGKLLVRIPDIALVNVVAGHRGVPELLQNEVTPDAIVAELVPLLNDEENRDRVKRFLIDVRARLGEPGASARAARAVLATLTPAPSGEPAI